MKKGSVLIAVPALWLAAGAAGAREPGCVVEGKAVEPLILDVASKGGPALAVRVHGVAATASIPETPGRATVEVRGALAFGGTAPVDKLPIRPKVELDSTNGMIRLAPGAGQLDVHSRRRWVEGDLTVGGVRFRGVGFACDGLTLDPVAAPARSVAEVPEDLWVSKGKSLKLRTERGAGPTMEVVLQDPADLELRRIERSGPWLRVSSRFLDGSSVTGWARASELARPAHQGALADLPAVPPACSRAPQKKPGQQLATAEVAAGTVVFYDRLFSWATVRGGDALSVRYVPGESWVELVGVPGMVGAGECPDNSTVLDEAWVPRAAVQLGGGAPVDAGVKK